MAGEELYINFPELKRLADDIGNKAAEMGQTLSELRTKANPEALWRGFAAEAYWQFYEKWEASQRELTEVLSQIQPMLNRFGDAMRDGDVQQAQAILSGLG